MHLEKLHLPLEVLLGRSEIGLGLLHVREGTSHVGRVDHDKGLALLYPLTRLRVNADHPTCDGAHHVRDFQVIEGNATAGND